MPVGHQRINAKREQPNPNITFIRVLEDLPDSDRALEILEALAAQFKPIMKEWGFGVNSLVEHEWNPTFAGRNWNAGEVIEIVLRRRDGSFAPYMFLLRVMSHELAHCKEMNHSHYFRKVNDQIRNAMLSLRDQGYYGDGFFSSGRLLTGYPTASIPFGADVPVYTCGGANRKRGKWKRRRGAVTDPAPGTSKARGSAVKLGTTGRQTAVAPKAGGRVKRKGVFDGEGNTLNADPEMSTKGRRAQAKTAVAARAAAAEARLQAEKRAKAAAERLSKPKKEKKEEDDDENFLDWDSPGDAGAGGGAGGWETDEEDRPEVKLEEEEKRWLREEMGDWEREEASGSGKGKKRKAASPPSPPARPAAASSLSSSSSAKGKSKTKAAAPPPVKLENLDLTASELAWINADSRSGASSSSSSAKGKGKGKAKEEESSDDEIEIIEPGVDGKRTRVCYMAMPVEMGGAGKGGEEGCVVSSSLSFFRHLTDFRLRLPHPAAQASDYNDDYDDNLPDPATVFSRPSTSTSISASVAVSPPEANPKKRDSPPTVKKQPRSPSLAEAMSKKGKGKGKGKVRFDVERVDESEDDEKTRRSSKPPPRKKSAPSSPPSSRRGPMKFFSNGSDAIKYAKLVKTVKKASSVPKSAPASSSPPSPKKQKQVEKPTKKRAIIELPSTNDDDDDDDNNNDAPARPLPAKTRSKGKKPRVAPPSFSDDDHGAALPSKRKVKKPPAPPAAKKPRKERSDKGKKKAPRLPQPTGEDEEDQLDESDTPPVSSMAIVEAAMGKSREDAAAAATEKGKGKGKEKAKKGGKGDEENNLVVVGLELRQQQSPVQGGAIKPFSMLPSPRKIKPKPSRLFPPSASSSSAVAAPGQSILQPAKRPRTTFDLVPPYPSPTSSASSLCSPPPLSLSSPSKTNHYLATLSAQETFNTRLAQERSARAKAVVTPRAEVDVDVEKHAEEAKKRIEESAKRIAEEAATRGATPSPTKVGGWGRNILSEGPATAAAAASGSGGGGDPVAQTQLEELLGVSFGTGSSTAADGGGEGAGPGAELRKRAAEEAGGGKCICSLCTLYNRASVAVCEACGLGEIATAKGWIDSEEGKKEEGMMA